MRFSDQSSVFCLLFQYILCDGSANNGNNAETQYILSHVSREKPTQTKTFLAKLRIALSIFDDQLSSLGEKRATACKIFITAYKEAFAEIWPKIQAADVTVLLNSVKDTELQELQCLSQQLCPNKAKPTLLQEKCTVPTSDNILGGLINRIPEQKLPGKEACSLIADIFSDFAEAHKFYVSAAKGLVDIMDLISPEQLTLILATAVPPNIATCSAAWSNLAAIHPATTP